MRASVLPRSSTRCSRLAVSRSLSGRLGHGSVLWWPARAGDRHPPGLLALLTFAYDTVIRWGLGASMLMLFLVGFCIFGPQVLLVGTLPSDLAGVASAAAARASSTSRAIWARQPATSLRDSSHNVTAGRWRCSSGRRAPWRGHWSLPACGRLNASAIRPRRNPEPRMTPAANRQVKQAECVRQRYQPNSS